MTKLFKVLKSKEVYDPKGSAMMNNLYFTAYKDVAQVKIAGLVFYELEELLKLTGLSATKIKQLKSVKPGNVVKMFSTGKFCAFYVVAVTDEEQQLISELTSQESSLNKVNNEIEAQVGKLLKEKKLLEKEIDKIKKKFK